ncbi:MAG: YdeI/OmpD-associated family protein [Gemmatimonadota bacterium]|jgi:uncharacterized protein YdeI (YjbR/CyaY-like superfamily)
MTVLFFPTPDDFRSWLAEHHDQRHELWVGYYKKATGKPSITWPESRDEALCWGWIDGIRKSVDEEAYKIRFTPRRSGSHWSLVNLERVSVLIEEGRMEAPGMAVYEARDPENSGRASYERDRAELTEEQAARFKAHPQAWAFWCDQPPGYRKQATWWVVSAKREDTRERRLATLIEDSASGTRIKQLRRA